MWAYSHRGRYPPSLRGAAYVADGEWHHAAFCHVKDWAGLFLDGALEDQASGWADQYYRASLRTFVGGDGRDIFYSGYDDRLFVGEIDYVQLIVLDGTAPVPLPWSRIAGVFTPPAQAAAAAGFAPPPAPVYAPSASMAYYFPGDVGDALWLRGAAGAVDGALGDGPAPRARPARVG